MWHGSDVAIVVAAALSFGSIFALAAGTAVRSVIEARGVASLPKDSTERALALLEERYARGEVDLDEYLQRRGYLKLENVHDH